MKNKIVEKIFALALAATCVFGANITTYAAETGNQDYSKYMSDGVNLQLNNEVQYEFDAENSIKIEPIMGQNNDTLIQPRETGTIVEFNDFTLKSNKTYTLKYDMAYKDYHEGKVHFIPDRTCILLLGLYDVNENKIVAADSVTVTKGKAFNCGFNIAKGQKVNFIFGNENTFNVGISDVYIKTVDA